MKIPDSLRVFGKSQEEAYIRLENLRLRLFGAIERQLKRDGHCKSYEGQFSIVYPNYFDCTRCGISKVGFLLKLSCYVVGGSRHYEWDGETLLECVEKAEKDILKWIEEADAND